jgi:hypothetical protein
LTSGVASAEYLPPNPDPLRRCGGSGFLDSGIS